MNNYPQFYHKFNDILMIILGISLPPLLVKFIPAYYYGDIEIFRRWGDCWGENIYSLCKADYPVIGISLTAGIIHHIKDIFKTSDPEIITQLFRYFLAVFDAFNFLLFVYLSSLMRFGFPIFIALLLLLVPSTWIGTAVWGQIDGCSLFFCLLFIICLIKSWLTHNLSVNIYISTVWLSLGSLSLSLYILTKQLGIFSIFFIIFLFIVTSVKLWNIFSQKSVYLLLLFFTIFSFSFYLIDSSFEIKNSFYSSSYWFILTEANIHKSVISWNGFNLWMFLPEDMMSSDKITLFYLMGNHKITVYQAGITLYSLFISFIFITGFRKVQKLLKQTQNTELYLIALLCFFLGLSYLGFNVLLTGTHERYLHLGYPFILIAVIWFYSQEIGFSGVAVIGCFFCATSYGLFVYSIMNPLPRLLFPFQRHQFLASIHLFLLLFLLAKWIEICQGTRLNRKIDSVIKRFLKTYNP